MANEQTVVVPSPVKQSFYSRSGARVYRVSSDSCWPLRRDDGTTWASSKAKNQDKPLKKEGKDSEQD